MITRLLPANRTHRLRIENNQAIIREVQAKKFPTSLDVKRRNNAQFMIDYFNKTGKVI